MLGRAAFSTLAICVLPGFESGVVLQFRVVDSSGAAYATFDRSAGGGSLSGTPEDHVWNVPSAPKFLVRDASGSSTSTGGGS